MVLYILGTNRTIELAKILRQAMAQNPYLHVMVQFRDIRWWLADYLNYKYNLWQMDQAEN
ncbi:hypothetical protein ACFFWB_26990 [Flavobacterium procerum]|uniref:hypothetical protein n=1 Tax=Flavobacterium procerum TaxID=1455569 RepID=UPI0035E6CA38